MANYAALKTEIAKPEYAGMTDDEICNAVNVKHVPGPNKDILIGDVIGYLFVQLKYAALVAYANNPPAGADATAVKVAQNFIAFAAAPKIEGILQTSVPAMYGAAQQLLGALAADEANSGISSDDVAAILSLANGDPVSWVSVNVGIPVISQPDLDAARAL